ncbi:MAG: tetratricopeptide repeat protein [Symploca sp. SIO3E6]|nr:tetratricopeptide repeat protein [Caldora sp. SIO3E6]
MRHLKLLFSIIITIVFLVLVNPDTAQAQTECCIHTWRGLVCGPQARTSPTHRISIASFGEFIQIGVNIAQGQATVDDYLLFAYLNAVDTNFTKAVNYYSQALDLAVTNEDIEGQAIARNNLGEVLLATGNLKEAVFILALARDMYQSLGNEQRVGEVQQRLEGIERLLKVNLSGSKIEPSQLQFDLSRI